jgi:hypothetical protein
MNHETALALAVLIGLIGTVLLYRIHDPECRCSHCAFHVQERAEAKRVDELKQKELAHNLEHNGWGFQRDSTNCEDATCPRNKKRVDSEEEDL